MSPDRPTMNGEPLVHTRELPEHHPLALTNECVTCSTCGDVVHTSTNECVQTWIEMQSFEYCVACFALLPHKAQS